MEEQRYPVNIRLAGVMHNKSSKLYMTTVLWSDHSEITVYRSLKDYKTLHRQLKKKFPTSNNIKGSERMVPKFKAARVIKNLQKWNPSKSMLRLKALDEYCTELLKRDPSLSQSTELMQFLQPNPQDLSSDLTKSSIVIMPSETSLGISEGQTSASGVTHPFVTETYRCLASYETKDTKNRPFKVETDETVDVLIKDKGGWWLVENNSKCLCWFPAPYLVKAEADDDANDVMEDGSVLYIATRSFKAMHSDEISVEIGSLVEVLQKSDNGWWIIRYNRKAGYVPSMYLQQNNNPLIRIMPIQKQISTLDLSKLQGTKDSSLGVSNRKLSRSQGNLALLSGSTLSTRDKQMSCSLSVLTDNRETLQTPPSIHVEFAENHQQGSLSEDSEDNSISDDSSSISIKSASLCSTEDLFSRGCTTMANSSGSLSLDSATQGKMIDNRSDSSIRKMPGTPKIPPRPQAKEIIKRCTTVTRKNLQRTS
ncbi:NADPH oxidase organizer 1 [Triplophysa tibetana]|uniref:NADPH oxidase organizer 1 n=1 Tax=Triplophysa tibetana TaxID=1572043 RepID=A0A5A9N5N1_9TELE|nr:NADPH oxidase organizer 1 [Triplophysa tibetana]